MQRMKMSYSKLSTFKLCPLKFKFQYLERKETIPSIALILGSSIHAVLEKVYDHKKEERTLEFLQKLFTTEWEMRKKKEDLITTQEQEKIIGKRSILMLENFLKSPLYLNSEPIQREEFAEMKLDNEICFVGRIDRVDKLNDCFIVVDYKTGKFNMKYLDFTQLFAYGLLMKNNGIDVKKSVFYYVESNVTIEKEVTPEILKKTNESLLSRSKEVYNSINTGNMKPVEGPLCGWCAFKNICPAKKVKN